VGMGWDGMTLRAPGQVAKVGVGLLLLLPRASREDGMV
jgi:hypothetical protein